MPQTLGKSPPRLVELNGFPLHLQIGRTAESPRQVVDFYERSCARSHHSAGPPPLLRRDGEDASLLVGVGDRDPLTLLGVAFLLAGIALLACYIPARRAYPHSGYEVAEAYKYYGYPAALAPEAGEQYVAAAVQLIQKLADSRQ